MKSSTASILLVLVTLIALSDFLLSGSYSSSSSSASSHPSVALQVGRTIQRLFTGGGKPEQQTAGGAVVERNQSSSRKSDRNSIPSGADKSSTNDVQPPPPVLGEAVGEATHAPRRRRPTPAPAVDENDDATPAPKSQRTRDPEAEENDAPRPRPKLTTPTRNVPVPQRSSNTRTTRTSGQFRWMNGFNPHSKDERPDTGMPDTCDCYQPRTQFSGHYNSKTQYILDDTNTSLDEFGLVELIKQVQDAAAEIAENKKKNSNKKSQGFKGNHSQVRILFLGCSLVRQTFQGFVDRINSLQLVPKDDFFTAANVDKQLFQAQFPVVWNESAPIQLLYRNSPYNSFHDALDTIGVAEFKPTHVFITRGNWDILFGYPHTPTVVLQQFPGLFTKMRKAIGPDARIIYQSLNYIFPYDQGGIRSTGQTKCSIKYDQEAYRNALYCAVRKANSHGARVEMFSPYAMSKAAGAKRTINQDGLHFLWPTLRVLINLIVETLLHPPRHVPALPETCAWKDTPIRDKPEATIASVFDRAMGCHASPDADLRSADLRQRAQRVRKVITKQVPQTESVVDENEAASSPITPAEYEACAFYLSSVLFQWTSTSIFEECFGGSSSNGTDCLLDDYLDSNSIKMGKICLKKMNSIDNKFFEDEMLSWGLEKKVECVLLFMAHRWRSRGKPLKSSSYPNFKACEIAAAKKPAEKVV